MSSPPSNQSPNTHVGHHRPGPAAPPEPTSRRPQRPPGVAGSVSAGRSQHGADQRPIPAAISHPESLVAAPDREPPPPTYTPTSFSPRARHSMPSAESPSQVVPRVTPSLHAQAVQSESLPETASSYPTASSSSSRASLGNASGTIIPPVSPPPNKVHQVKPSDVFALLQCALCSGTLEAGTTLRCGHSVCSTHVQLQPGGEEATDVSRASASSSPARATGPNLPTPDISPLPSCPVKGCVLPGSSSVPDTSFLPQSSRVAYYPPPQPVTVEASEISLNPRPTSPTVPKVIVQKKIASPKMDILLGKVQQLTAGWVAEVERRRRARAWLSKSKPDDDEDDDEGTDEETTAPPVLVLSRPPPPSRPSSVPPRSHTPPISDPSSEENTPKGSSHRPKAKKRRVDGPARSGSVTPPSLDESTDARFIKELFTELQCEICFSLLFNPVTTPCQHTFCGKCLSRTLDHRVNCPLCREELPGFAYFHEQASNQVIQSLILHAFPQAAADRKAAIEEEERVARLDTPIFVCQLSFPGLPTILHIFEPRYRLMIRRCLESPDASFGMIMPPRNHVPDGADADEYGTMLEIRSVQMLPDGRSMVETRGTHCFRILEKGHLDGYMVAKIDRVDDCSVETEALLEQALTSGTTEPTVAELMETCRAFYEQLRSGTAPWVVQQMNNTYGPMPEDPSTFSYWMVMLLPIDDNEKAKLLPVRSPRLRLRMVVHWIESLNNSWWFGQGCQIC